MAKNNTIRAVVILHVVHLPNPWLEDGPHYYFRSGTVTRHPPEIFFACGICHSDNPSKFHRIGCLSLDSLPPYRCPADPLAPYFSATLYPCLIWSSAGHLADPLAPYMSIHCMASLHRVTLYIVVNLPAHSGSLCGSRLRRGGVSRRGKGYSEGH